MENYETKIKKLNVECKENQYTIHCSLQENYMLCELKDNTNTVVFDSTYLVSAFNDDHLLIEDLFSQQCDSIVRNTFLLISLVNPHLH